MTIQPLPVPVHSLSCVNRIHFCISPGSTEYQKRPRLHVSDRAVVRQSAPSLVASVHYSSTTTLTLWVTGSPPAVPVTVTIWIPEFLNLWVIAEYGR